MVKLRKGSLSIDKTDVWCAPGSADIGSEHASLPKAGESSVLYSNVNPIDESLSNLACPKNRAATLVYSGRDQRGHWSTG